VTPQDEIDAFIFRHYALKAAKWVLLAVMGALLSICFFSLKGCG
jgi:hypothetical protein